MRAFIYYIYNVCVGVRVFLCMDTFLWTRRLLQCKILDMTKYIYIKTKTKSRHLQMLKLISIYKIWLIIFK